MATSPGQPSAPSTQFPGDWSLADLRDYLGDISLDRIRLCPPPGCATEEDVNEIQVREDRLFELEAGILVEKAMGWYESLLAGIIITELHLYLRSQDLGKVFGADGPFRILPGVVKIPDVSFISWERWPKEAPPRRPIPALIPDLVVEVLSETNTEREMDAKLEKYFEAGVRLVWYVDPATRSARVFAGPTEVRRIEPDSVLDGGDLLPGFQLSLRRLFEEADRQGPADRQGTGAPSVDGR